MAAETARSPCRCRRAFLARTHHDRAERTRTPRGCWSVWRATRLLLEAGELYRRRADDTPGDIVLHGENVVDFGIVCFGPHIPPVVASVNSTPTRMRLPARRMLPSSRYRAFSRRPISAGEAFESSEREAGRFRDDKQVRETAECGNDVFSDPVAEEIMTGIAGQVLEWQNRHRRTLGEASRCGESRHFDRLDSGAKPEQV